MKNGYNGLYVEEGALAKPLDMETFPDIIRQPENGETVWQIT